MSFLLSSIDMELIISPVLQNEVQQFLVSLALGVMVLLTLQALSFFVRKSEPFSSEDGKAASLRAASNQMDTTGLTPCVICLRQLWKALENVFCSAPTSAQAQPAWLLRQELSGQIVRWLEPSSVSALGAASSTLQRQFWQSPEVWRQLSMDRGLDFDDPTAASLCAGIELADAGASAREAFRRGAFRIDGMRLRMLAAKCDRTDDSKVLAEATHMMSGLMLRDGQLAIEGLCAAVVKILQEHDSGLSSSAETSLQAHDSGAVELFLQTARRRLDLLTTEQLDRLEVAACDSAARLDTMMEIAMRGFYAGLPNVRAEMQDVYLQPSEGSGCLEQTADLWEAEYDGMQESDHEVRRREAVARMLEVEYDLMHEAEHELTSS